MKRADVAEALAKIAAAVDDPESAHVKEDDLFVGVLEAIASGEITGAEAQAICNDALTSVQLNFPRWYA